MDINLGSHPGETNSPHYQIKILITTISLVIVFILIYLFFIFRRRSMNLDGTNIEMTDNPQPPDQLEPISIDDLGITEATFDPHSDTGNPYGMHRCHFCQMEFLEGEPIGSLPTCNHIYHTACLADSVASNFTTCPVCRLNMIAISVD